MIVATGNKVVMEPTLDEALKPCSVRREPRRAKPRRRLRNSVLDQARGQLAEVQKAIDALNLLLNKPAGSTPANTVPHK